MKMILNGWVREVEAWGEVVDGAALLDELAGVVGRFVVLPKDGAVGVALWVLHTYAFERREVTAYLGIESPEKRCGKTTLLAALNRLANRPVTAANISSSAFFRVIEEARPTLLIDEADTFLAGNEELRGILNSGYTRSTAYVVRVGMQGKGEEEGLGGPRLARFSCWCPKAMAAIGRLPETLADRCLVLRMQRKTVREKCERLRDWSEEESERLRRQCARFVSDHGEEIGRAKPVMPEGLNDRAADIWEPLLALADLAGPVWAERARAAALGLTNGAEESSPIGLLLLDILLVFQGMAQDGRLFSRTLAEGLNGMGQRPWQAARSGRAINELWLAGQLAPYGIRPRTMRMGNALAKGYVFEAFFEAFRRYIPKAEWEAAKAAA